MHNIHARVKWPSNHAVSRDGFKGSVDIYQCDPGGPALYRVRLRGLPPNSLHGFHIHALPIHAASDLEKTCASCGGHFNPTNTVHGSVLRSGSRHVGDLINNVWADENGEVNVDFSEDLAILISTSKRPWSVIDKSIVVHEGVDDLGAQGAYYPHPPFIDGNSELFAGKCKLCCYEKSDKRYEDSLENGNAGKRLACGNIKLVR